MSFLIITFVLGLCLSVGTTANAAMLILASALIGLACLARAIGAPDPGAPPLWAFVEAWLTVATLQLGFMIGAAGRTLAGSRGAAPLAARQSTPAQDESGS